MTAAQTRAGGRWCAIQRGALISEGELPSDMRHLAQSGNGSHSALPLGALLDLARISPRVWEIYRELPQSRPAARRVA